MEITLGSVTLDGLAGNMVWTDELKTSDISQNTEVTLGGQLVIFEQQLQAGRDITLVSTEDTGWLTKAQVIAVKALEVVGGAPYTLTLPNGEIFQVGFRSDEPPAVDFEPALFMWNPIVGTAGDYFIGTLKLRTI